MYCTYCGAQIPDQAVVCMNCGCATNNFRGNGFDRSTHCDNSSNAQTGCDCENEYEFQKCYNTKQRSPKSGIVTLVLLILCGTIGVHRMYMGKIGSGISMLLLNLAMMTIYIVTGLSLIFVFGWIIAFVFGVVLFLWWLIDLVTLLSGKFRDSKGRIITLDN